MVVVDIKAKLFFWWLGKCPIIVCGSVWNLLWLTTNCK